MPKEIKQWITVNGQHIPIYEGESKEDAVNRAIKNKDEDDKEKQIAKNKKQADTLNKDKKEDSNDSTKEEQDKLVADMIKNKEFSKFGQYLVDHRSEYNLTKTEDAYTAAYDIIKGTRELRRKGERKKTDKRDEHVEKVVNANEDKKQKQINQHKLEEQNRKNGPAEEDANKSYFDNTSVEVTANLKDWVKDSDKTGIPQVAGLYMDDSSINDSLVNHSTLSSREQNFVNHMDKFTESGTVKAGTNLYVGLVSNDKISMWDKDGKIKYPAYLSTTPDPVYAKGYSINTDTMLKIEVTKDTKIGKMYYSDSTGTEGVLGRNNTFEKVGESVETIRGEKIRVITVRM